jgi:hypothetical protein
MAFVTGCGLFFFGVTTGEHSAIGGALRQQSTIRQTGAHLLAEIFQGILFG